ncbi:MAG: hypothetical protein QM711_06260 [Micropruina sp.]|uniref:ATP-grasp domain-containing protein n=1 Tax=Micropruina sp. TaxID=2737536 RepID=UPI0039E6051F
MALITLITSGQVLAEPARDPELILLRNELAVCGVRCAFADWVAASELSASDLVIIKSPWDYAYRSVEFLGWLGRAESQTRVLNPPEVIRWNLDKRYLGELADRGVPVCPTTFCGDLDEVRAAIDACSGRVVVKPTVSASSADTGLFQPDDPAALALARRIVGGGKQVMVQPAVDSVATAGERSLIYLAGEFAHAVGRAPVLALGGGLRAVREPAVLVDPEPAELAMACRILAAASELMAARGVREPFLHARVDLVRGDDGRPLLLELELFEPSLFLHLAPGAGRRYAEALMARLEA